MKHPEILDARVIGSYEPGKELQLVLAYVVRRSGSAIGGESLEACIDTESAGTAHLTGGADVLDSRPGNESGKMLRRVLQEPAARSMGRKEACSWTVSF